MTYPITTYDDTPVIKDSKRLQTDVLSEVDGVMEFIKKHINKEIIITDKIQNTQRWQYPIEALRELTQNRSEYNK